MFALVITIHVIVCSLLILIVLIQQGKGGGLVDSFSSAENIFGTKTSAFLIKSTSVLAVIFFITCLCLALMSIQKSRSVVERYKPARTTAPASSTPAVPTSAQEKTPATSSPSPAPQPAAQTAVASEQTQPAPQAPAENSPSAGQTK